MIRRMKGSFATNFLFDAIIKGNDKFLSIIFYLKKKKIVEMSNNIIQDDKIQILIEFSVIKILFLLLE